MADTYYNRFIPAVGTPGNCALSVVGTAGSTSYEYQVAAYNWNGETIPCAALDTTTGNALLSVTNYNHLEWDIVENVLGYCIYGRVSGGTYGLLYKGLISDFIVVSSTRLAFNDTNMYTPNPAIQPGTTDTTGRQKWDQLLFRANKSLQSAELNEIQAIQDYYTDNLGKAFFREGSIIKGCSPSVQSDLTTVIVDSGEVYIAGKVRYIDGGSVTISLTGSQIIGLLVTEVIVTETDDEALNDPAVGAYNYGKDSAHRKTYTFDWVVNNANAVKVFDVNNGAIIVASSDTDYAQLNKMLATRTYEESGNYVVDSTVVIVKEHATDDTKLAVSVDALRAYVQGYRIERTKGAVLDLNKARDSKEVGLTDAKEQFNKTISVYVYELANKFVKDVNSLDATLEGGPGSGTTKGAAGGKDTVVSGVSLVAITSVTQGGTTYYENVNWTRDGNQIDWALAGPVNGVNQPLQGTSYDIVYQYRDQLDKGTRVKTTVVNEAVVRGVSPDTADDLIAGGTYGDIIDIDSVTSVPLWVSGHSYSSPFQIVNDGIAYNCILAHTSSASNAPGVTVTDSGSFTRDVGTTDLVHVDLLRISSVTQGTTTYHENVDWQMSGNNIDWSLGGDAPLAGSSYDITYDYNGGAAYWSTSGATGIIYVEERDWYKVDGQESAYISKGQVNWNLSGDEPAGGSTYYVSYTYWNHSVEGDYVCAGSFDSYPDIGVFGSKDLRDSIDFRHPASLWTYTPPTSYTEDDIIFYGNAYYKCILGNTSSSGNTPGTPGGASYWSLWGNILNDNVNVDYNYYLTRKDLLVVSTKGEIFIIEGISDVNPARPKPKEDTMAIAELRVQAYTYGPKNVQVTMLETKRSTMEDIKTIEKRVSNIEYYQALDLLEKDAIDQYTIDAKSGVMVDNFKGSSRADVYFDRGGVTFGVAFDTGRECIQMQSMVSNIDLEKAISVSSTTTVQTGKMMTLPYTNELWESQPFASQKKNVTPYLVFPWKGNLALDPREDYWVDTEQAPDLRVSTGPTAEEMDFWNKKSPWQISATPWEQHITGVRRTSAGTGWANVAVSRTNHGWRQTNFTQANEYTVEVSGYDERKVTQLGFSSETQVKDMGDRIIDTTISPYIRSKIINVTGSKLRPSVEIGLKMDDKVLEMVPVSPTVAGGHTGTVMTDATGKFTARFTIPAATFNTGERAVSVYNYNGDPDDDTNASAVYNAFGIGQTRQKTYLSASYIQPKETVITEQEDFKQTRKQVEFRAVQVMSHDPLCQSFQYGASFFLTQLDLFFASKDSTLPCTVQIRTMDNGYPAPGILGTVDVYPSSIHADETGATPTRITFPEPIFIEADKWYSMCILADVTSYNMWIATMGGTDITTGNLITKQPHNGTLFTSSNNVTWVADPNSDLKFNIYCAIFPTGVAYDMVLNTQQVNASILDLCSTEVLPGNVSDQETSLTWYLNDNPGSTPLNFDKIMRSNETTYFQYEMTHSRVKASFQTNNELLSPVLNMERLGLLHAKYDIGTKSYITRNVDLTGNDFSVIKVILESNKPTNTGVHVFHSVDDGYNWTEFLTPTSTMDVDSFWTEYQFLIDFDPATYEQFRIRIDLTSTTTVNTPRVRKLRVIAY